MSIPYNPGDPVVFRMSKHSTEPGPRATDIHPAPHGDTYSYLVNKYWTVAEVHTSGEVLLVTRRGKRHLVAADDPRLRPARWWERLLYRHRFPGVQTTLRNPDLNAPGAASSTNRLPEATRS